MVFHIYSKYAWVIPAKDKKDITITLGRKPNKIWVDKTSKFYNRSMKSWLQDNDIEIHSTHNEWKSVAAK